MKKENIKIFIEEVFGWLWIWFLVPGCIFLLFFLGAINSFYPHESTFEQDLNFSSGYVGLAFYSMYEKGYEYPIRWSIIFAIFLIGSIYFYIDHLRDIKWVKESDDNITT